MNNLDPIENSDSKLLNWKRISLIMLALFLISVFTSHGPDFYYNYKVRRAIQKTSSQCPIEIADGFRLDSIKVLDSREICLFLTDELGRFEQKDTSRLKEYFVKRTEGFMVDPEFQSFLKQGYSVGLDLKDYLQNPVFRLKMDPSSIRSTIMKK